MFAAWPCSLVSPKGCGPTLVSICWVGMRGGWNVTVSLFPNCCCQALLGLQGTKPSHLPGWGGHPAFPAAWNRGMNQLPHLPHHLPRSQEGGEKGEVGPEQAKDRLPGGYTAPLTPQPLHFLPEDWRGPCPPKEGREWSPDWREPPFAIPRMGLPPSLKTTGSN